MGPIKYKPGVDPVPIKSPIWLRTANITGSQICVYSTGRVWLHECDIRDAAPDNCDITNCYIQGCDVKNSSISKSRVFDCTLDYCRVVSSIFKDCKIVHAHSLPALEEPEYIKDFDELRGRSEK